MLSVEGCCPCLGGVITPDIRYQILEILAGDNIEKWCQLPTLILLKGYHQVVLLPEEGKESKVIGQSSSFNSQSHIDFAAGDARSHSEVRFQLAIVSLYL